MPLLDKLVLTSGMCCCSMQAQELMSVHEALQQQGALVAALEAK
jgi:hypothetical protein